MKMDDTFTQNIRAGWCFEIMWARLLNFDHVHTTATLSPLLFIIYYFSLNSWFLEIKGLICYIFLLYTKTSKIKDVCQHITL